MTPSTWTLSAPLRTVLFFMVLIVCSLLLFPALGRDFFPQVDAGQMRLHVRAPPGTRLEQTQADFAQVEATIRKIAGRQSDRYHSRQHWPAVQRHEYRVERLGNGRADGW